MKNPPSFPFYPRDFLSDLNVVSMTEEEVGKYIKLLCFCWIEDGIQIKGGSRVVLEWFNQSPSVARCFVEKDGKYRNPRLDLERQRQVEWRKKSSIGGLHSAQIKQHNKGGSRVVQPNAKLAYCSSLIALKKDTIVNRDPEIVSIMEKWNSFANEKSLPQIMDIPKNSTRERLLKARLKDNGFTIEKMMENISKSPFLLGMSEKGWRLNFDWAIKPSNYLKIMEGAYFDRGKPDKEKMTEEEYEAQFK